jgi:hypothetical protein
LQEVGKLCGGKAENMRDAGNLSGQDRSTYI